MQVYSFVKLAELPEAMAWTLKDRQMVPKTSE
jgi:hypothetical protein